MVDGPTNAQLSPHARSRVTNGHHFITGDARTVVGRRLRDLVIEFSRPFGGFFTLDEPLKQLVKRAALLSVEAEAMESRAVAGEQIDTLRHVTITNALNRCLARLEGKAKPTTGIKSAPGALAEIAAQIAAEGER